MGTGPVAAAQPMAPPPGTPSGGYGAPGYTPPPPPPPKKKKKSPLPIILLAVLGVLVIGGCVAFVLWHTSNSNTEALQNDYNTLRDTICAGKTPGEVAAHQQALQDFKAQNPDLVEKDLTTLVTICVDYEEGNRDLERTFTNALDELDELRHSEVEGLSRCVKALIPVVESDYDLWVYIHTEPPPPPEPSSSSSSSSEAPPPSGNPGYTSPYPYEILSDNLAEIDYNYGDSGWGAYSFSFANASNKRIEYIQFITFCYDSSGARVVDSYDENYELGDGYISLAPGETFYAWDDYWWFNYLDQWEANIYYVIPFISYVEFEDGTTWGYDLDELRFEHEDLYLELLASADSYASELAG